MNKWLQRIRGLIGTGVTWSIPWGVVTGLLQGMFVYLLVPSPEGLSQLSFAIQHAIAMGIAGSTAGFGTGVVFSVVLMVAERRGAIDNLKMGPFAAWGAAAGGAASLALSFVPALVAAGPGQLSVWGWGFSLGLSTTMGAVLASSTLAIARSGSQSEEALLRERSFPQAVSAGT